MNIKELKELIKDLPDEMPVVEAYSGPMVYGIQDPNFSVENIYEWQEFVPGFKGIRLDGYRSQQWIECYAKEGLVNDLGKAFCIMTEQ